MTTFTAKPAGSSFILKADGTEFARVHDESDFSGWEVCMLKSDGYQWPAFDHLALTRSDAFAAAKRLYLGAAR
jgi:hypothetical protein